MNNLLQKAEAAVAAVERLRADRDSLAAEVARLTFLLGVEEEYSAAMGRVNDLTRQSRDEQKKRAEQAEADAAHLTLRAEAAEHDLDKATAARDPTTRKGCECGATLVCANCATEPTPDGLVKVGRGQYQAHGVHSVFTTPTEPTPPPAVGRCKTCKHFGPAGNAEQIKLDPRYQWAWCRASNISDVPADGSGFCHLYEAAK